MTPRPKRNKILQSLYLEPEQAESLDRLAERTRIPKAVLLREAVDKLLLEYSTFEWLDKRAAGRKSADSRRGGTKPAKSK